MGINQKSGKSFFSLQLHPKNLFLPATLALVLVLRLKYAMPLWGLLAILSILPFYYFVLPRIVKRKERLFEREVLRLLQQGKKDELLKLYRRQTLLRFFGPKDKLQKRLGFIYSEIGDFDRARACYARAARTAGQGERLGILLGLAGARYRSGDYEGAEVVYRELLRRGQQMPEVVGGLAHTLVLRGRDLGEALRLAKRAVEEAPEGQLKSHLRLTLAEILLAKGKVGKARKEFEKSGEAQDTWFEARRAWVSALFEIKEGNNEKACDFLEEVAHLDKNAGLGDLAERRLSDLDCDSGDKKEKESVRWAG